VNGTALGVPNMLDKEVLIYIISLLHLPSISFEERLLT
jgi:hypothetical protein